VTEGERAGAAPHAGAKITLQPLKRPRRSKYCLAANGQHSAEIWSRDQTPGLRKEIRQGR